jgi:hypothetical protein
MIKKMLCILVILSFLGFSTAYAYDQGDDHHRNDQGVAIALIVALTVVTVVWLIVALDGHGGHWRYPRYLSLNIPNDQGMKPYGYNQTHYPQAVEESN